MEKIKILDIKNTGLNMAVDELYLYIRNNRFMYKYDLNSMNITAQNEIFKKDGKARGFSIFNEFILLWDFLDLYILRKDDLTVIDTLRLGENLSSDICGVMWFNSPKVYIKIRNGWIYVLDISTKCFDKIQVSDTSFWSDYVTDIYLYAGTVTGELLEIDKTMLQVTRKTQLHKKNIYSIICENGLLYTASQDGTIKVVNSTTFEILNVAKKAVVGMVEFVGIHGNTIIIAGPRNPLALWDKNTLQLRESVNLVYNRDSMLCGNILYFCDNQGIYKIILT